MVSIPLERISKDAREMDLLRGILACIAAVLYGLGWITAKVLGGLWFALTWTAAAVRLGWVEARKGGSP